MCVLLAVVESSCDGHVGVLSRATISCDRFEDFPTLIGAKKKIMVDSSGGCDTFLLPVE